MIFAEYYVDDLPAETAFFVDGVGLEIGRYEHGFVELMDGLFRLHLASIRQLPDALTQHRTSPAGARTELGIEVANESDLARIRDRLLRLGHIMESDICRRPWGRIDVRFFSPAGIYVRLTTPYLT